nr:unnamed protein product [Digitaria exilis]
MGVVVDALSNRGTPLHLAAANGYDQAVKMLLEHGADAGADVNFVGGSGQSVLMTAVEFGFIDTVKFLVEAGADPNIAGEMLNIAKCCAHVGQRHGTVRVQL